MPSLRISYYKDVKYFLKTELSVIILNALFGRKVVHDLGTAKVFSQSSVCGRLHGGATGSSCVCLLLKSKRVIEAEVGHR